MKNNKKLKVLLIYESIFSYRDPIFKMIADDVDFTVAYTVTSDYTTSAYPVIKLPYCKIGPFIWHKGLRKIVNQYDVVVFLPHLRMLKVALLPFLPHKPKLVSWSIGVHVSYNRGYDLSKPPSFIDRVYEYIQDKADSCVFYMQDAIDYWKKYKKIDTVKYFVAHNTVKVEPRKSIVPYENKDSFLFIGTLYKQKGLGELINAYAEAFKVNENIPVLNIIGKGPEKESLENLVLSKGLKDKICFIGPVYDESILSTYFGKAKLCISPKQAGLSVLKSLGYGVPFVTRNNAITGGERNNIIDGENGLLYNSEKQLADIILESITEIDKYSKMSDNAYKYYHTHALPQKMAQGVLDAIKYAITKR